MNLVRKMTIFFLLILMIYVWVPVGVFAAKVPRLDVSDVLEDLQGLKIGGKSFDPDDYPLQNGADPQVLGMYEHGWGTSEYALYVYLYVPDVANPNCRYNTTFDGFFYGSLWAHKDTLDSQRVSISLETNQCAKTIDISEDGRFVKVKIDPSGLTTMLKGATKRVYAVGLLSWYWRLSDYPNDHGQYVDELCDFEVGQYGEFWSFTGSKSYYQNGEIIELKVNPSMYKSGKSDKGEYYHDMLYTAYFTIPSKYVDDYDHMVSIKAEWEEKHTSPVVTTDNKELYDILVQMAASDKVNSMSYDPSFGMVVANYKNMVTGISSISNCDFYINGGYSWYSYLSRYSRVRSDILPTKFFYQPYAFNQFDNVFLVSDINRDFLIPTVGSKYDIDGDGNGDVEATYLGSVDEGRKWGKNSYVFTAEDILSINPSTNDYWTTNFGLALFIDKITGKQVSLDPFHYVDYTKDINPYSAQKENTSLYIGSEFWADFYSECKAAQAKGDQVVLFRFATRDYYSADALYFEPGYNSSLPKGESCTLTFGTAFIGFDIIELAFSDDEQIYFFDVNADPVDYVPGVHDPDTPGGSIGDGARDAWDKLIEFLWACFKFVAVAAAVVAIVVLIKWTDDWRSHRRE